MTDLDDGLDTSAPVWTPPTLDVDWQEQFPNLYFSGNPDRINDLSEQMTGEFNVEHSLDDGLPDAVTMTTSADASGKATIPLNGRQGVVANTMGLRTAITQTGSAVSGFTSFGYPSGALYGDYLLVAVTINDSTANFINYADPTSPYEQWKLLSETTDGAALKLGIFGKRYWDGEGGFDCDFSVAGLNYSAVMVAAYARGLNPNIWVDLVPQTVQSIGEPSGVAVSAHTAPVVPLRRRGFALSVWASATGVGPFTYTGSGAEMVEVTTPLDLMVAATALQTPGDFTLTATTTTTTTTVAMASIALEVADRPTMDARAFFSPFNQFSPVYGWARDTADAQLTFNVITPVGPVGTTLHKGQMASISVKGRQAEGTFISKTRLDLDKSLTLPVVFGNRENCSVDWLATWAMARGGQWVGPGPGPMCRFWAPLYGSTHAHYESRYAYSGATYYDSTGGPFGLKPPSVIEGPFLTAMYAQQTATRTEEIFLNPLRLDLTNPSEMPATNSSYDPPFLMYDQFSKASSQGNITFWMRGDPVASAPAYLSSGDDMIFRYNLYCQNAAGTFLGWVIVTIRSSDRLINVYLGGDLTPGWQVTYASMGAMPTDGSWNFIGVAWDFAAGAVRVRKNGLETTNTTYASSGGTNVITQLPNTDAANITAGGKFTNVVRSHLPISDLQIEAGSPSYGNGWGRFYPSPEGMNATMRPTYQPILAVAESTPVKGWDLLSDLAKATMSAFRCNEVDNFEFLPLGYFGESEQMTPTVVADTEVNAGELDVVTDPSKVRNSVTIKFDETRVATQFSPILTLSSAIELVRGYTTITFALDEIAVEIHKQNFPFSADWILTNLTAAQITTPTTIPTDKHYFSVNTSQDGSGSVLAAGSITGQILSANASSITILFTNRTSKSGWIANNGDQVPFLRILGYPVTVVDGYTTQRDEGSITARRERSLDVEIPWVQDRGSATELAQLMVTQLARPRPEVSVTVMGDPRRAPGQLVTLNDAQGTQAEGNWRILKVVHNGNGPEYTQDLQLTYVPPTAVWDGLDGWDNAGWGE